MKPKQPQTGQQQFRGGNPAANNRHAQDGGPMDIIGSNDVNDGNGVFQEELIGDMRGNRRGANNAGAGQQQANPRAAIMGTGLSNPALNQSHTDDFSAQMGDLPMDQDLMEDDMSGMMMSYQEEDDIAHIEYNLSNRHALIDKEQVKTALKDLKDNYKMIEQEIEETTKKKRDEKHSRYQSVMDEIESLKQNLKTEVNNRKEREDQFMQQVEAMTKDIHKELTLKYLNNIYLMKEKITQFETRKENLNRKLDNLSNNVDIKISKNQRQLLDQVDIQKKQFQEIFREQVDSNIKKLKQIAELEYNFNNTIDDINRERESDVEWLHQMTQHTINDTTAVYQKQEATRKILLQQVNFLKQRLKLEIDSRKVADNDIFHALEKYKELINQKI